MRRRVWSWIVVAAIVLSTSSSHAAGPSGDSVLTARSAILIDDDSGAVLWEHNPDQPLPPASTTKIVTALLALQSGRLDESFSVSTEAATTPPSKISLRAGSRMRLNDLVYAVLLNSANDASVVIAEGLSGSVPAFARQMNAMARLLGARNTHFANPNGLPDDDHYSSARDLATMFRHAMRNPLFVRAVNTKSGEVWPTSGARRRIALHNHNRLLDNYRLHVVGKTGWTRAAKKCFVGSAEANGRVVSFAIMGSTDLWGDIKRLLEFGLEGADRPGTRPDELLMAAAPSESTGGGDEVARTKHLANDGQYSVRLGSFRSYQSADQVRSSMARRGYKARIEKIRERRGSIYRVAVGQYPDRRAAQTVARDIKSSHRNLNTAVVAQR